MKLLTIRTKKRKKVMQLSIFNKALDTLDKINDKFSLEQLNNKSRDKLVNEKIIPMLDGAGIPLSYEEVESFAVPLNILMMPNALATAINLKGFIFANDDEVMKDNKILSSLTPILKKIDNINIRYNGHPPSQYLKMDTYMSNEEMEALGLTNEERAYYIKVLFSSKKSTSDIPPNLRPYIYTEKDKHTLVFKRRMPEELRKEFSLFFFKFYTIGTKEYPTFREYNNSPLDLEKELRCEKELLNSFMDKEG